MGLRSLTSFWVEVPPTMVKEIDTTTVAERSAITRAIALDSCQVRRDELLTHKTNIELELSHINREIEALEAAEKISSSSLLTAEGLITDE